MPLLFMTLFIMPWRGGAKGNLKWINSMVHENRNINFKATENIDHINLLVKEETKQFINTNHDKYLDCKSWSIYAIAYY